MASAAEQLAANLNLGAFAQGHRTQEAHLVHPGRADWSTVSAPISRCPASTRTVMGEMLMTQHGGGILGMFDMFTGGALGRMTVFALNIMPYISASIIIQLMTAAIPSLEALKKEGEMGRKKLNQYTRYLTVVIAMFQAYGIAVGLESMHGSARAGGDRPRHVLPRSPPWSRWSAARCS